MRRILDMLTRERVVTLASTTKDDALAELCGVVSSAPQVTDPGRFLAAIKAREAIMSTGIGMGIAIPHAKTDAVTNFVMAAGRSEAGIDFQALDGFPVHLVILIGASDTQSKAFLSVLSQIGAFFNRETHRERFLEARTEDDIYSLFQHLDDHNEL